MDDEPFLRAIVDDPGNDSARLVYADWLEGRGDSRAEFLRIQEILALPIHDKVTYRLHCEREQNLISQTDPAWVQRVRRYTTSAPCRNLAIFVPDLVRYAHTTTRLHPHRASQPLPEYMSKIGGRFLWPNAEPWPTCVTCKVNLAPILQLRSSYVPDIAFPAGTDLLQLFWCPDEEAHNYNPAARIHWRSAASVTRFRTDDPDLSRFPRESSWSAGYVPHECSVYPERVLEYPLGDDLSALVGAEEERRINSLIGNLEFGSAADVAGRFEDSPGFSASQKLAYCELSQCPGSKVGGKPGFIRDGRRYDHLVTISTWEVDAASFHRWLAVEDQRLIAPPGEPLSWQRFSQDARFQSLQEVHGMELGRTQRAHVFLCRDREPWEVDAYVND
jgi:uncharacterized protein (TIGR02996 family)